MLNQTVDLVPARDEWRKNIIDLEDNAGDRLIKAYDRVLKRLQPEVDRFNEEYRDAYERDKLRTMTTDRLRRNIEKELGEFRSIVRNEALEIQDDAVLMSGDAAKDLTLSVADNESVREVINVGWNQPDPEAIRPLVNYADSPAFRAELERLGVKFTDSFADMMISYIAQGKNPNYVARELSRLLKIPFHDAVNQVRTIANWSYREGTLLNYKANSHYVRGWIWSSSLDSRTCSSCLAQHGMEFSLDEKLNDHHRGRCAMLPRLHGSSRNYQSGAGWFAQQSAATQKQILGPAKFKLYQQGRFDWSKASQTYSNDVFGEMRREATLAEMMR